MNAPFDKKFSKKQFSSIFNYPLKLWNNSIQTNLISLIAQASVKYFAEETEVFN